MRKIDRFDEYMEYAGLNDNKVTQQLGLSVGTIGKSRKEGRDLSRRVIEQILKYYTDLDEVWLLTGEGCMLNNTAVIGDNNNVNNGHDQTVTVDKSLVVSLRKSQEQIDRLISIIERLTNTQ